ncbi:MAG TPA: packaged DNA stabilization gp4 family protein [Xylella fastidiosa subsp. pauca]
MTKVAEIIRDALGHLRVLDANEAVEAEDAVKAMRALNLMMRRWEANGIALGWSEVASPDDLLPAPAEAQEAIGYSLAVCLRASYGVVLEQDVVSAAERGRAMLISDTVHASGVRMQYDLPAAESQRRYGRDGYDG